MIQNGWPLTIQTKSPLVLRDIGLLKRGKDVEAGFSITTADDSIRRLFEPCAPSVNERIMALEQLHLSGVKTFAMIAPMLPGAEGLVQMLGGKVDYILVDRMNYHHGDWVYKRYCLEKYMDASFFNDSGKELAAAFEEQGIECRLLY